MIDRFDGVAAWNEPPPETQAAIGAAALELVASWEVGVHSMEEPVDPRVERASNAAEMVASDVLAALFESAITLPFAADRIAPPVPSCVGAICRGCGCTEFDACPGGCSWVQPDLCSSCREAAHG